MSCMVEWTPASYGYFLGPAMTPFLSYDHSHSYDSWQFPQNCGCQATTNEFYVCVQNVHIATCTSKCCVFLLTLLTVQCSHSLPDCPLFCLNSSSSTSFDLTSCHSNCFLYWCTHYFMYGHMHTWFCFGIACTHECIMNVLTHSNIVGKGLTLINLVKGHHSRKPTS